MGETKQFTVGRVTVTDNNNYIARSNENYESTFENMESQLLEDQTGGHFRITHEQGDRPTIHYLADFEETASQAIEFGVNLKDFVKKTDAAEIATAIIPRGGTISEEIGTGEYDELGEEITEVVDRVIDITSVNGGVDYVYSEEGVERLDFQSRGMGGHHGAVHSAGKGKGLSEGLGQPDRHAGAERHRPASARPVYRQFPLRAICARQLGPSWLCGDDALQ